MIARIRHFLFDNFSLKLAALAIAILMWYGVARDPVAEITLQTPIEFSRAPENLDYSSDVIPQAQIRLRGPARILRDLPQEDVRAIIDLKGALPGEHTYDLTASQIRLPHDVEIMQIIPSRLHLVFDQHATRQVPVKPRVVGTLPPGYRLQSVTAKPATLTVTGPARHVNAIENALTDAVDITGVTGQDSFEAMPYLLDPLVRLTGSGPVEVIVTARKVSSKAGVH